MATTIVTKYSDDAPAASDIVRGELAVDTENGRLYTENSSGAVVELGLNPEGNVNVTGSVTANGLTVDGNNSYTSNIKFDYGASAPTYFANWGYKSSSDGNKVFLTITDAGAAKDVLVANYNGDVGIGTSSPAAPLSFGSTTNDARIYLRGNTNEFAIGTNGVQTVYAGYQGHVFQTGSFGGTERLRIDANGTLLLTTPFGGEYGYLNIKEAGSGDVRFGKESGNDYDAIAGTWANNAMKFYTNSTERMRIDSSGNLLVGKTALNVGLVGQELRTGGSSYITASSDTALGLNRLSTDGTVLEIRKDSAVVGSIGANGGNIYIGQGDTTIMFSASSDAILPKGTGGASRDNAIDLGQASVNRFNDAFITNGVTTGSDGNDKQDVETLSDAEQRVAVACKGLLRKWRWKSAVEEKGDDARIHFGIIAQDLQAAFEAEGLDAGRYAMFMSNTWADEETGEERTRLGIRYHELLAFIIAAI